MAAFDSTNQVTNIKSHVRFDNRPRRASLNLAHIKFDLLKISELYDGYLTEDLALLPMKLYTAYLDDLKKDDLIYEYRIEAPEFRMHEDSGNKSFTYTFHVQGSPDRTAKVLKIHVGLYKSAWKYTPKCVEAVNA